MNVKEYKLENTAEKTAKENDLIYVNGNCMTKQKLCFDFSFLETLNIPDEEMKAIIDDATKHCNAVNRTAFVFYNADNFTMFHAIVDFNVHTVYNAKTGKFAYRIMEAKHIKYNHAERKTVYEQRYTENVREFEADSKTDTPMNDYEV